MGDAPSVHDSLYKPAPWDVTGDAYWITVKDFKTLPEGAYNAYDEKHQLEEANQSFRGGGGLCMLYRYHTSPVGPYNELIFVPGKYTNPFNSNLTGRISRIYVDNAAALYNGRYIWNVSKHYCEFKFTDLPAGGLKWEMCDKGSSTPFFSTTLTALPHIPAGYVDLSDQARASIQPPCPAWTEDDEAKIGTDKWISVSSTYKGTGRPVMVTGGFDKGALGDGKGMSKLVPEEIQGVAWNWMTFDSTFGEALDPKTAKA